MDHADRRSEALRHLFLSSYRCRRRRSLGRQRRRWRGSRSPLGHTGRGDRDAADRFPYAEESRSARRIRDCQATARVATGSRRPDDASCARRREREEEDHPAVIIRDITAPNPGPFTLSGTRTYLLGESTVIDPGPAIDSHIEAIRDAMPALRTVLLTHLHEDHAPAAGPLKRATGARIVAPAGVLDDTIVYQRVSGG